jgi:hypothetical protein
VSVDQATEAQTSQARDAYLAAKEAYDQGKYDEAVAGFRTSYEVVASPNSHLMMAKALRELQRVAEAYAELKVAVEEADAAAKSNPKYEKTGQDARAALAEMQGMVGYITVRRGAGVSGPVTVNGALVDDLSQPVIVDPGTVVASIATPDGAIEKQVTVGAGGTALVELSRPGPVDSGSADGEGDNGGEGLGAPRIVGIAAAGVGAVGMVMFGVFGANAVSAFDELEQGCPNGGCPADLQGTIDDGKTFQTVANVGLVIGVTGLIAGAALILIPTIDGGDGGAEVALSVGPGALGLHGSF